MAKKKTPMPTKQKNSLEETLNQIRLMLGKDPVEWSQGFALVFLQTIERIKNPEVLQEIAYALDRELDYGPDGDSDWFGTEGQLDPRGDRRA